MYNGNMHQEINVLGNLGRDPEMRYLPNGDAVLKFSVASTRRWLSRTGEKQSETTWFSVSAFGRLAETLYKILSKGDTVFVSGRLMPDPKTGGPRLYKRGDGTIGASFEVIANKVIFVRRRDHEQMLSKQHPVAFVSEAEDSAIEEESFAGEENVAFESNGEDMLA